MLVPEKMQAADCSWMAPKMAVHVCFWKERLSVWHWKCNLKKVKISVFKKGGELEEEMERLFMYDQIVEVVDE